MVGTPFAEGGGTTAGTAILEGQRPGIPVVTQANPDTDARPNPADIRLDPGDPVVSASDSAPLARGADRASATHAAAVTLPAGLGHRLAEAVGQFPDRPVEITLSPEELGRVRLTLATHDGALTMMIQADRQDTLDLLRRNIGSLAQDFRDLGYQDLSFSFGQERDPRQPQDTGTSVSATESDSLSVSAAAPSSGADRARPLAVDGGLDLRL
ncbi:flagellar hook-length control protein FliK [Defluviimonas sp. SAOS-178_SWC]|uniref:flagellar hook-length control protein FliK n=1 Tax=Defluviimonas sp. SAOS-178_SWC TaxID=3121287 RepID=UPI003221682B